MCRLISAVIPERKKIVILFKVRYFANGKFAKFEFRLSLDYQYMYPNGSINNWNLKIWIRLYFFSVNLNILSQIAKFNSVNIFIQ